MARHRGSSSKAIESILTELDLGKMPARSVIASVLMGAQTRGISTSLLVRIASLFNVSDGTARVAMSRMASDGEIVNHNGRYRLAGRLVDYQRRLMVREWPVPGSWDGAWQMLVVTAQGRSHADRQDLRRAMRSLRLAEFASGVWVRPDNNLSGLPRTDAEVVASQCAQFTVSPDQDDRTLSGALWDLNRWNSRADRLLEAIRLLAPDLEAGAVDSLAPGLLVSAAAIRHAADDPILPASLLPTGWVGDEFRTELILHDTRWQQLLRSWARTGGTNEDST